METLNGIKYDFERISVETALKVQELMVEETFENSRALIEIAVNHLRVYIKDPATKKEQMITGMDMEYYGNVFDNPLYVNEIIISFAEIFTGFMNSLPKLQQSRKTPAQGKTKGKNN